VKQPNGDRALHPSRERGNKRKPRRCLMLSNNSGSRPLDVVPSMLMSILLVAEAAVATIPSSRRGVWSMRAMVMLMRGYTAFCSKLFFLV
jgi:hypothetical protein